MRCIQGSEGWVYSDCNSGGELMRFCGYIDCDSVGTIIVIPGGLWVSEE